MAGKNKKEQEEMIKIEGDEAFEATAEATVTEEAAKESGKEAAQVEAVEEVAAEAEAGAEELDSEEEKDDLTEKESDSSEEKADDTAEEAGDDSATGKKSKKIFGKKKDKKDEQIEELQDKVKRQMAEFDNFRKRSEKEKSAMYSMGARDVLEKMLEVLDNFERGLGTVAEGQEEDPFVQGMQMVYKQMTDAFEKLGVKPIEAVGQAFDPNLHNAVMHEDNEEAGENEVVAEFQKGYTYRDDVIRHSMVKVAN